MYEQYFGLTSTPFTRDLPPEHLFLSDQHKQALARLKYAVKTRAFALLTGEIGTGKSTLLRALHAGLDQSREKLLYVAQSSLTPRTFYRELLYQLGTKPKLSKGEAKRQLDTAVWDYYKNQNTRPIIAIDEGHLLSPEMLEEIRFLTNFHMDSASPMALILIGQTELRQRLRLKTAEAIAQRVNVRFHLTGLSDLETKEYILHHLKVAGAKNRLFSNEAIKTVHHFSKGIPRRINNLCHACLLDAFTQDTPIVDEGTVKGVLAEFQDDTS